MNHDRPQPAEELDAFVSARLSGRQPPPLHSLPPSEAALVDALLALADTTSPDPGFAARLQARVRAAGPRQTSRSGPWRPPPRLLGWAALVLLLLFGALLIVPEVRAGVLRVLRIGGVSILLGDQPAPGALPPTAPPGAPVISQLDLAGATTLEAARRAFGQPIRLPAHPPDLGPPDQVFLQDMGAPAVVLVWLDRDRPDRVRLSLHLLGPGGFAGKLQPPVVRETSVHAQPALWTEGPYLLQYGSGDSVGYDARRLVTGHVLLWAEDEITYRLETSLPLEEAVLIAESLR